MTLFDELLSLVEKAEQRVILIAPFVKVRIVQKIIEHLGNDVDIKLITRWRPEEIALGVSDIEVWDVLSPLENARIFLCQNLHAKCFVSDDIALVGSANLTSRGLGAHQTPNLECLVRVHADRNEIVQLLRVIDENSVPATLETFLFCKAAVENLPFSRKDNKPESELELEQARDGWLPKLRQPDQLFLVYSENKKLVTRASLESASIDLDALQIAGGLSEVQFNKVVMSRLFQMNYFHAVFEMANAPRKFGEYRQFTRKFIQTVNSDRSATDVWQAALRWILHFGSGYYYVESPRYSEILMKVSHPMNPSL